MGRFVNPDNSAFKRALNSKIYVDKTGLLEEMNALMDTEQCCICNSRPRRFGKTITANMMAAYYSCGCDSGELFDGTVISRTEDFRKHLNQYDVIRLDIQWFLTPSKPVETVVRRIEESVVDELRDYYPDEIQDQNISLADGLSRIYKTAGKKFIVIIDEWDVLIREETEDTKIQKDYIEFLRTLFKGSYPAEFLHLAYLTGILPIKKVRTQSALNNFEEFTMLEPDMLSPYIGFTEEEVRELCVRYHRNYENVKRWYNGYVLGEYQVYNPKAVVSVMMRGAFRSYWSQTGTYESILPFINMNFDGLKTAIIQMLSGTAVEVNVNTFQNDMVSFKNKDDVITLLIHLGYLTYSWRKKAAYIPNEEIRQEFLAATQDEEWSDLISFQQASKNLLDATLAMDCRRVAEGIETFY